MATTRESALLHRCPGMFQESCITRPVRKSRTRILVPESANGGAYPHRQARPTREVRQAQGGDVAAFERLYREHSPRVYALCLRMSADPLRAEELTQDVFVRAWEKLGTFRGGSAFSTWLHRLAVNVVLGSRRAEACRHAHLVDDGGQTELESVSGVCSDPGTRLDLERAIAALPEASRTVFLMHDVEGYTHGEISQLTGRSEGTSKSLLSRARQLLRAQLEA